MRMAEAENRFSSADEDNSGSLDLTEFIKSKEAALAALQRGEKVIAKREAAQDSLWLRNRLLIVTGTVILCGMLYMLLQKPGHSQADQANFPR
jgi:hypothetical protein